MYNPGDLYSDLGFEPLNDSSQVKQYYGGGYIPQAQDGESINSWELASSLIGVKRQPSPENYNTPPYNLEHFTKYLPEYKNTYGVPNNRRGDIYDEMFSNLQKRGMNRQEAANIMSFLNKNYDTEGNVKNEYIKALPSSIQSSIANGTASSATNCGLKAAAQVGLACSYSAVYVCLTLVISWCLGMSDIYSVSPLAEFGNK
jgi:hypothetical protein